MMMSCGRLNGPCLRRCSMMREASAGPIPGNRSNSSVDAVLMLMRSSTEATTTEASAEPKVKTLKMSHVMTIYQAATGSALDWRAAAFCR